MNKIKVIKKIESADVVDVFDIEVANEHHYILESGIVSHNSGWIFGSSIVVAMRKLKLKEDYEGTKTTDVKGIRAICKCMKTRYNKPFEQVELRIPWDTGLDPYSGLIDLFKRKGLLVKDGTKLGYTSLDGIYQKHYEKRLPDNLLDLIMQEYENQMINKMSVSIETSPDEYDPETGEIIGSTLPEHIDDAYLNK
jgi:hypothetical protein